MEFLALLKLIHILGIAAGTAACLMLMLRLCIGGRAALAPGHVMRNLRIFSYTMLAGVLVLSFSAGALFVHNLLTTSALPANGIMGLRSASLASIAVCTALLHVYLLPYRAIDADAPEGHEKPLAQAALLALATSATLVSWVMWMLSGLSAGELKELTVMHLTAVAVALTLVIWSVVIAFVIGNRLFVWRHMPVAAIAVPARRRSMPEFAPALAVSRLPIGAAQPANRKIRSRDLEVPAPAAR
jgi:hypothetical protein